MSYSPILIGQLTTSENLTNYVVQHFITSHECFLLLVKKQHSLKSCFLESRFSQISQAKMRAKEVK